MSGSDVMAALPWVVQIAGLFHDPGKLNEQFQRKLRKSDAVADAFRHEWVSLRLFAAYVGKQTDVQWLQALADQYMPGDNELAHLQCDGMDLTARPLMNLPPLAQAVGWLIVSHHRLPLPGGEKADALSVRELKHAPASFDAAWHGVRSKASITEKKRCWKLPVEGLFASHAWRSTAAVCAQGLLAHSQALMDDWREDAHALHVARMALMLADHVYSRLPANPTRGDPAYPFWANTNRRTGLLRQRLDEHCIGVAEQAGDILRALPALPETLPGLRCCPGLHEDSPLPQFAWQNQAYALAQALSVRSREYGLFAINMASTGCGKTLANGRMMYGLADLARGARFTLAMGLRTLTLQTGQVYRDALSLDDAVLAVMVGGVALDVAALEEGGNSDAARHGSESAEALLDASSQVHLNGVLADTPLAQWLGGQGNAVRLTHAPVLACTIDHLMPACESLRGGGQIAPMLRLLTADLVLDEPDDFGLEDLPALSRLVFWAGLLGSRVLLSSATVPPALAQALFVAYQQGRHAFSRSRGRPMAPTCCAWFDEFTCQEGAPETEAGFVEAHQAFVQARLTALAHQGQTRRRMRIIDVEMVQGSRASVCQALAARLPDWMQSLHQQHGQTDPVTGKRISIGVVRLANVDPLIDVARALWTQGAPDGWRVHLCVYHARHPQVLRAMIERQLDDSLRRHGAPDPALHAPAIRQALAEHDEPEHLFVVLASPAIEIGRDLDFDWAIAEPSSMRALIQLAGRIRRHRPGECADANLWVLPRNIASWCGRIHPFSRPGFACQAWPLKHHDLRQLLLPEQYVTLDAAARIQARPWLCPTENWVDLEHARLADCLLGRGVGIALADFWLSRAHLCGVWQARSPFRQGQPQRNYAWLPDEDGALHWHAQDKQGGWRAADQEISRAPLDAAGAGVSMWAMPDYGDALMRLALHLDLPMRACAERFGGVSLDSTAHGWTYHPLLGCQRRR